LDVGEHAEHVEVSYDAREGNLLILLREYEYVHDEKTHLAENESLEMTEEKGQ
jgi:hypothetical protein